MKHSIFKQLICCGVVLAPAFLLTGCVDNSYGDLDNIDLTMGLGSDGLGLKLGNTEKIMLDDILSVDENVKLDRNNLYYLVEDGTTDFDVNIDPFVVSFDIPTLGMEMNVLDYEGVREQFVRDFPATPVPEGQPIPIRKDSDFAPSGVARSEEKKSNFTVTDISMDVKHVNWVSFENTDVILRLIEEKSDGVAFGIKELRDVEIVLPQELQVSEYPEDLWDYVFKEVNGMQVNALVLKEGKVLVPQGEDLTICKVVVNKARLEGEEISENRTMEINSDIVMNGIVDFKVTGDFDMAPDDFVTIKLEFDHGTTQNIDIIEVNGGFDPEVDPDVTRIEVFNELPDFLNDKDVKVSVTNPTLKFTSQLQEIPIGFNFGATMHSVKEGEGAFNKAKTLPQVTIDEHQNTTVYYYQDPAEGPYDPELSEIPADAVTKQVDDLGALIETLPDYLDVDMGNQQIRVRQDKDYTLQMNHTYTSTAAYDIYVPFEFDSKLVIVYKDSTNSFKDDLEDYAAHGLRVTAKAENTIPLALLLGITAVDTNGDAIPGITFTPMPVKAGKGENSDPTHEELNIDGDLSDPTLLSKIDRLVFNITADGSQNGDAVRKLVSTQYIRLTDVRVRLKGQVIADFN